MKQQVKKVALGMMMISMIVSMFVAGCRIKAEYHHKTIQVGIRYVDALQIAKETSSTLEEVLQSFKEIGVNTLLVREDTVQSPQENKLLGVSEQGQVEIIQGTNIPPQFADRLSDPQITYVVTEDEEIFHRIYSHLTVKGIEVAKNVKVPYYIIGINEKYKEVLTTIGIGFDQESLQVAADLGFAISPEVRGWKAVTDESIAWMVDEISQIPNLNYIYFEDKEVPGYEHEEMIQLIKDYGLGFVEFYAPNQNGLDELAYDAKDSQGRFQLIRMFTDEKVENISTPNRVARYELALTERGIRAFTFILQDEGHTRDAEATLKKDISDFIKRAKENGYSISTEQKVFTYGEINGGMLFIIGLATIGVVMLLMEALNLKTIGLGCSLLIGIGYMIGLFVTTSLAVQGMALLTAIVFPLYGIVSQVNEQQEVGYRGAIKTFLSISGITLAGGLTVVGLLSQSQYALGIDGFRGVKVAHMMPLVLIIIIFGYQYREAIKEELKQLLQTKVSYGPILLMFIVLLTGAVFAIYLMRTGNGEISEIEKLMRQGLDQILGVRPRTKEFLIGHPLMVTLLYFGYKGLYLPVLVLATIGQISLMNTYAHIHTPLMVSLIRSIYGIGIGIVIGIILIQVVKFIFKVINKWIIKQK